MVTMRSSVFLIILGVAVVKGCITWPEGTYGLQKPKTGCPSASGFRWHSGIRYHDTEDNGGANKWSNPYDLAGKVQPNNMEQAFCIKTDFKGSGSWPPGEYCILKKGNCPAGFNSGYIHWDDEDSSNRNNLKGALPDGSFGRDTTIYYCCRSDGQATNDISLPTDHPFVLLKSSYNHNCQHVKGMQYKEEYFFWDCEDSNPSNGYWGYIPRSTIGRNIKIEYCYYYGH